MTSLQLRKQELISTIRHIQSEIEELNLAAGEMVLVLDNCRWHHAKALSPWLEIKQGQLRLEFLPPYSPELNPIQRVWKLARRLCTHNRYFATLEELIQSVENQFNLWLQPNEQLRRLCAMT